MNINEKAQENETSSSKLPWEEPKLEVLLSVAQTEGGPAGELESQGTGILFPK